MGHQIRSAKVILPFKKTIGRPLNILYPNECSEKGEDDKVEEEQLQTDTPVADVRRRSQTSSYTGTSTDSEAVR